MFNAHYADEDGGLPDGSHRMLCGILPSDLVGEEIIATVYVDITCPVCLAKVEQSADYAFLRGCEDERLARTKGNG